MEEIPSHIQCELKCLIINEVQSWELELRNQAEIDTQTIQESKTKIINGRTVLFVKIRVFSNFNFRCLGDFGTRELSN